MIDIIKKVFDKDYQSVNDCVHRGDDVDSIDEDATQRWLITPIGLAVAMCDVKMVKHLLRLGANPEGYSHERIHHIPYAADNRPVTLAALNARKAKENPSERGRRMEILRALSSRGANPWQIVETDTRTAVDALLEGASAEEMLSMIQAAGDKSSGPIGKAYAELSKNGDLPGISLLSKSGVSPNEGDIRAAMVSAFDSDSTEEVINRLLEMGASMESLISVALLESLPAHIKSKIRKKSDVMKKLLSQGKHISDRNELMAAIAGDDTRKVRELLARGGDATAKGMFNMALSNGNIDIAKELSERGAVGDEKSWEYVMKHPGVEKVLDSAPPVREIHLMNGKMDMKGSLAQAIISGNDMVAGMMINRILAMRDTLGEKVDSIMENALSLAINAGNEKTAERILSLNYSPSPKMSLENAPEHTRRLIMENSLRRRPLPTPNMP